MIRELRVNGLNETLGSNAGSDARGGQAGKPRRQMTVEVEEENVVKEITISKEEFDPRVSNPSDTMRVLVKRINRRSLYHSRTWMVSSFSATTRWKRWPRTSRSDL